LSGKIFVTLSTVFLVALSATGANAAQCDSVDQASRDAVRDEVNRLFNKTLDATEYVLPSGVKVATWTGWEHSTQDQIACLGPAAIPATVELLRGTTRSFGRFLAIHMLGWEGGPDIVPPLAEVLAKPEDHPEKLDSVRLAALNALVSAPPDRALPVIDAVLRSEKNPDLFKEAMRVKEKLAESR
jgi:HEAT repeat protein